MIKIKFIRKIKLAFLKILRERASVSEIALGAAIGTFISVFPTFGFGMPLVIVLSKFMKYNLMAALALSLVSNPFTSPFFLISSYTVGAYLTGNSFLFNINNWKNDLSNTGFTILIGSLIVSGTLGLLAYLITYLIVLRHRKIKSPSR